MSDPEAPEQEVDVEETTPSVDASTFDANEADVQEQLIEEPIEDDDYGR